MSEFNDVDNAIKHAFKKEHIQAGDTVDAKVAANMLDDIRKELDKNKQLYTGDKNAKASVADMSIASRELGKSLQKYGIADIQFFDSGKDNKANNKVDKNDTIAITEKGTLWNSTTTVHVGDRFNKEGQQVKQVQTKPESPTWSGQLGAGNENPMTVRVKGYDK